MINYIDLVSLSVLTGAECWRAPFFKCCWSFLLWILRYVTQIRLRVLTPYTQRRTRKFHVVVMQRQRVNVPESVMHGQSCCFSFTKPIPLLTSHCRLLWRSLWRRCHGYLKGPCQGCVVHFVNNREIKHRVYGKREIQVEKFSKWEMSRQKQLKTILMDRIGVNLPIFRVVIMNSKQQVNGKLGHGVQIHICCLP